MQVSRKLIENVGELKKALNEISVYDFDVYTSMELYYKIANKLNEVIKELMRFEGLVSDEVIKQNEKLQYLLGEGLNIEVVKKINQMVADGTMDTIINHNVFNSLNNKIEDYKEELSSQIKDIEKGGKIFVNAKNPIITPTYDGSYQAVHPKVLFFKDGWGKGNYQYWMAMTPYKNTDDGFENPSILVSRTGDKFMEITNNPIDKPTDSEIEGGAHMSDTHLVMVNGVMECWYRYNPANGDGTPNNNVVKIYKKTSIDGVNWSDRIEVFNLNNNQFLSPCINYEDGKYKVWYVNYGKMYYRESIDGTTWSNDILCTTPVSDGSMLWHGDIIKTDLGYEMVMSNRDKNDTLKYRLYYSKSDDGLVWSEFKCIIEPSREYIAWDNRAIYRSSIVKIGDLYKIYYSAQKTGGQWYIGLTEGYSINSLYGNGDYCFFKDVDLMENLNLLFSKKISVGPKGMNANFNMNGITFGDNSTQYLRNFIKLVNQGVADVVLKCMNKINCLVIRNGKDDKYGTVMANGYSLVSNTNNNEANIVASDTRANSLEVRAQNGTDKGDVIARDVIVSKNISGEYVVDSGTWKNSIIPSQTEGDTIDFIKTGRSVHANIKTNSVLLTADSEANAIEGCIAWNKVTKKPMYYNGTSWIDLN